MRSSTCPQNDHPRGFQTPTGEVPAAKSFTAILFVPLPPLSLIQSPGLLTAVKQPMHRGAASFSSTAHCKRVCAHLCTTKQGWTLLTNYFLTIIKERQHNQVNIFKKFFQSFILVIYACYTYFRIYVVCIQG